MNVNNHRCQRGGCRSADVHRACMRKRTRSVVLADGRSQRAVHPRAFEGHRLRPQPVRARPGAGAALGRRSGGWPPRPRCTPRAADDFLRTRLTHSLEVAQIAREMGARLGCDPDVVDVAGLAHDLGHPPFGHNGEDALDEVGQACGGFEGNAQTLRVLTRLEAKVSARRAPAGSTSPGPRSTRPASIRGRAGRGSASSGCTPTTARSSTGCALGAPDDDRRCLEAQVMDWADDVAYSVHDVEDGIYAGFVELRPLLRDADERAALCADVAAGLLGRVRRRCCTRRCSSCWPTRSSRRWPATTAVARRSWRSSACTSVLTGRFVAAAVDATREQYGDGTLRRYDADLVVPRAVRHPVRPAQGHRAAVRDAPPRHRSRGTRRQREILRDLVAALAERAPDGAGPGLRPAVAGSRRRRGPAAGGHRPGRLADRPGRAGLASAAYCPRRPDGRSTTELLHGYARLPLDRDVMGRMACSR